MTNTDTIPNENTYEEKKKLLQKEGEHLQKELFHDFAEIKHDVKKYTLYAVAVGGAFVGIYYLTKLIFPKKKNHSKKDKNNSFSGSNTLPQVTNTDAMHPIAKMILNAIGTFLLSLLKKKVEEVLENRNDSKATTANLKPAL